tara:strand:+ start:431 stop:637 length:207 start_codon:yes stop_codon:yes gene_type:complete
MKKKKKQINSVNIPYSLNQENPVVEIKRLFGDDEQRVELIFRTGNSYVSHTLSLKQYALLKEKMSENN